MGVAEPPLYKGEIILWKVTEQSISLILLLFLRAKLIIPTEITRHVKGASAQFHN
jgi:hypothetical protein